MFNKCVIIIKFVFLKKIESEISQIKSDIFLKTRSFENKSWNLPIKKKHSCSIDVILKFLCEIAFFHTKIKYI